MQRELYENEESGFVAADLREGLILSGIAELENHGLGGFSLRRVAAGAGVSCAAPYKHFKSKEDLILAIYAYIHEKWTLLREHICLLYEKEPVRCLVELCLANIRFWIGNPHFRSVNMMEKKEAATSRGRFGLDEKIDALLHGIAKGKGLSPAEERTRLYTVRSLLSGAILLLADGELENDADAFLMFRRAFENAVG